MRTPIDRATLRLLAGYVRPQWRIILFGGILALMMRAELARPGLQFFSNEQYNQLFTLHGTIMLLLFATPLAFAFANLLVPLQIGSPDVAFPRLNALSYWLFLFGGLLVISSFLTADGAASFGWTAYAPLNNSVYSAGTGCDLWIVGLVLSGLVTALAWPYVRGYGYRASNPSALPLHYGRNLLIVLAAIWSLVAAVTISRRLVARGSA